VKTLIGAGVVFADVLVVKAWQTARAAAAHAHHPAPSLVVYVIILLVSAAALAALLRKIPAKRSSGAAPRPYGGPR
jgi:hypothetical protein